MKNINSYSNYCIIFNSINHFHSFSKDARNLAERICNDIAQVGFATESGDTCSLKLSMGVTGLNGKQTLGNLLHRVDKALYEAKRAGKNQVVLK